MKNSIIIYLALIIFSICSCRHVDTREQKKISDSINLDAVKNITNIVIHWQKENMPDRQGDTINPPVVGWADGVFFSAIADWSNFDNSYHFKEWYEDIAREHRWQVAPHTINPANDIAIGLTYGQIWLNNPKPQSVIDSVKTWEESTINKLNGGWMALKPTIERLDYQIKYYPKTDNLDFDLALNQQRWCWCDALYMAAPTYALFANITDKSEYRDFMDREFWKTTSVLYDSTECLFYRDTRYINMKSKNGAKVFWGRGNGWVVASMTRILNYLPKDYPSRYRYEKLFKEIMARLVTLQDANGYWNTSLLDRQNYQSPESSATGFICYALWWGINNNLLSEKEYLPYAIKAWKALVASVHENGMIGYVQPIGDAPENITKDKTEVYGTAAFALAGLELSKYLTQKPNRTK